MCLIRLPSPRDNKMQASVRGRHSASDRIKEDMNNLKLNVVGVLSVYAKRLAHLN